MALPGLVVAARPQTQDPSQHRSTPTHPCADLTVWSMKQKPGVLAGQGLGIDITVPSPTSYETRWGVAEDKAWSPGACGPCGLGGPGPGWWLVQPILHCHCPQARDGPRPSTGQGRQAATEHGRIPRA